jgi:Reverse transcriptase (RNA-dependent DNA polymerase)
MALQQLGIPTTFLRALQATLDNTYLAIKIDDRHGPSVPSVTGVPHGCNCPLSPTLFGVLADGLPRYLQYRCPGIGIKLPDGTLIATLGYADDFTLVAATPEDLQSLMHATREWCIATNMKLNGSKTQILAVNPTATSLPVNVSCCGSPIEVVEKAKYLGLHFHFKNGLGASTAKLEQRFWMAWADLIMGYSNLQCGLSVFLIIDL